MPAQGPLRPLPLGGGPRAGPEEVRAGDPIEARPETAWERLVARAARHRGRILAAAAALGFLAACGLLALRLERAERAAREERYEGAVVAAAMRVFRGEALLADGSSAGAGPVAAQRYPLLVRHGEAAVREAVADLRRAIELAPARAEACWYRARALALLGRREEVLADVEEALRRDPRFAPARVLREELLAGEGDRDRGGSDHGAEGRHDRSEGLDAGPAARPEPAAEAGWAAAWARARRAVRGHRWKEAASALEELIALEEARGELYLGSSVELLLSSGAARSRLKDHDGAARDLWAARTLALRSWGELIEPVLLLGRTYYEARKDAEAEALFAGAFERARARDETALWIAAACESAGRRLEALAWARRVESAPVRARLELELWAGLGRFEEAVEAGRRAVALAPGDAAARLGLAQALLKRLWLESRGPGAARRPEPAALEELRQAAEAARVIAIKEGAITATKEGAITAPGDPAAEALLGDLWKVEGGPAEGREPSPEGNAGSAGTEDRRRTAMSDRTSERHKQHPLLVSTIVLGLGAQGGAQEGFFSDKGVIANPSMNSPFLEWSMDLSADGRTLYFASDRPDNGDFDLYAASREGFGEPFGDAEPLCGSDINTSALDAGPSISRDGQELYFYSDRSGQRDIYGATPDPETGCFVDPQPLEINTAAGEGWPCISADGLELYFSALERPGGTGQLDLWVAWRDSADEPFRAEDVRPLSELNSPFDDASPAISADGKTIFWSGLFVNTQVGGKNRNDIWWASREETGGGAPFQGKSKVPLKPDRPYRLSPTVSSLWPAQDAEMFFASCVGSSPETCFLDIYAATWTPPPPPPPP
ncbi:MAG: PD40 domain-containing protein, partial [Planctomycetes bacterium]|nr:PD40 domain-containing protein [Planctomycetota bacterium]